MNKPCPGYLRGQAELWAQDPRAANQAWFAQAGWGMFIHFGLYSLMGMGEWVQYRRCIPVAEYATLANTFTARNFDAQRIADLAVEAEMKYITLVTCHHDGFCLWDSPSEPFNSAHTPCGRDLLAELAEACRQRGLGLFAYYTFMLNWRFPHFLGRESLDMARPAYAAPQPEYLSASEEAFRTHYVPYMQGHLRELLTRVPDLAGLWLDIIMAYYLRPDLVPVDSTYQLVRTLRPECLLAYKQGATGAEDFATPEMHYHSLGDKLRAQGITGPAVERADAVWAINRQKHNEICMTLQKGAWGYQSDAAHLTADEVWQRLAQARAARCNMLANIGPLPDGSIHPADSASLREVGRRIRAQGLPTAQPSSPASPAPDTGAGAA